MNYKDLNYQVIKNKKRKDLKIFVLHGWGHSLENMLGIANNIDVGEVFLIDLPGFGKSEIPDRIFGVDDYAKIIVDFINANTQNEDKIYIVGHSFGGKIAVEIAGFYPDLPSGIFVVAGAGFRTRKNKNKIKIKIAKILSLFSKILKTTFSFFKIDITKSKLYQKLFSNFASDDYKKSSTTMRKILKKTISYNSDTIAKNVVCGVYLIYGEKDTTTPPSFAKKYSNLIKNSQIFIIPNLNHINILDIGKYKVSSIILNNLGV